LAIDDWAARLIFVRCTSIFRIAKEWGRVIVD
jgi:hypothetical protein